MSKKAAAMATRYSINLHDTLSVEKQISNGKENPFFVVVKNTPFLIVVSSKEGDDFRKIKISANLLYDCEPTREVQLIRSSPLEYVSHLSANGEEITIEARIHVLTSQHEDSLFRVCVKFGEKELTTEPLKVISKADTTRKSKDKTETNGADKKKRSASDAFGDVLSRMEQEQKEQRKLIDTLCKQNEELMVLIQTRTPPPVCTAPLNFEEAFASFINSYGGLEPCERPQKMRALRQLIPAQQRSIVAGLMRTLAGNEDLTEDCISAELPDLLGSRPLSPSHANNELTTGYWHHIDTLSPTTVCVPSSPDLGDLGNVEKDALLYDVLDFLNV